MANYYVRPGTGSDANGGTSWASDSWATLKKALDTVTAGDHTIWMSNAASDVITTNTTYTVAAGVKVVSTADGSTYTAGASVTSTTAGVDIVFGGQGAVHGVEIAAATTLTSTLQIAGSDNDYLVLKNCILNVPSTTASTTTIGNAGAAVNCALTTYACKWRFGNSGSSILQDGAWRSYGDVFADSGTVPTTLFTERHQNSLDIEIEGGDLSALSSKTIVANMTRPSRVKLVSCLVPATFTPIAAGAGGLGACDFTMLDCSYDNAGTLTGALLHHENYLGSTTVSTAVYAADGLTYDGTHRCSWVVAGTSAATTNRPYMSPWLDVFNDDVSTAITPSFEIARIGASPAAFTNAEVGGEWAYRGTANSPKLTFVNDFVAVDGTAANQTASAKAYTDWTGLDSNDNLMKLHATASFTPAEVGYLRARVLVGANVTAYVDPQVRGLA